MDAKSILQARGIFVSIIVIVTWLTMPSIAAQTDEQTRVKTVIDNRCTICHGCYDAPCQLKMSSYEGLLRGANPLSVYDPSRLIDAEPTRLFIDAHTESEWRLLGFNAVIDARQNSSSNLFSEMLSLKTEFSIPSGEPLPSSFPLDINRELSCPAPDQIGNFKQENPEFGMPYGFASLPGSELMVLQNWIDTGFPNFDRLHELPDSLAGEIEQWESFLNSPTEEEKLVSRYIYEHLFLGYLTFEGYDSDVYFRLIRSYTPANSSPIEIATLHPTDNPGVDTFFYRIIQVRSTSLEKTRITYSLSPERLDYFKNLFYSSTWTASGVPGYSAEEAANPFAVFQDIPARIRYEFLLNEAHYFINNFIKGPVCRGQVALNVIPDHLFVGFLSPDYDLSVVDDEYLVSAKEYLALPSKESDVTDFLQIWLDRLQAHADYLSFREDAYRFSPLTKDGFPLEAIWNGSDSNQNFLTVFRHFDSATVLKGLVGATPKTAWIIDYPTLERIYYDLVANYNVFGNVSHQILTRLYMDYLRMESEGLFLAFLPAGTRQPILEDWYRGMKAQLKIFWAHSNLLFENPTKVEYQTASFKVELFTMLRQAESEDVSTQVGGNISSVVRRRLQTLDNNITSTHAWVDWMPELSYLLIYDKQQELVNVSTLLRNKAHTNVSFIFGEEDRRVPLEDTTTLVLRPIGSYPNFFFSVSDSDVEKFVSDLRSIENQESFNAFVETYGIRRTDTRIWPALDDIHAYRRLEGDNSALLDMNRYSNF